MLIPLIILLCTRKPRVRVEGEVTLPRPRRSVRAQFTHTVPPSQASHTVDGESGALSILYSVAEPSRLRWFGYPMVDGSHFRSFPQWESSCIPASIPDLGRPPSLLPGSRRFSVPRFSIGTMQTLRLPTHPLWLESISPRGPELPTLFSWLPPVAD